MVYYFCYYHCYYSILAVYLVTIILLELVLDSFSYLSLLIKNEMNDFSKIKTQKMAAGMSIICHLKFGPLNIAFSGVAWSNLLTPETVELVEIAGNFVEEVKR